MSNHTVGTCSICGGPVQVPFAWYGLIPPTPKCAHCGAEAKAAYGPTIQMEPKDHATREALREKFGGTE